jgi:hypothetical protein
VKSKTILLISPEKLETNEYIDSIEVACHQDTRPDTCATDDIYQGQSIMLGGIDNHLFYMSLAGIPAVALPYRDAASWTSARGKSVVQRTPKAGTPDEYGTLVPVATPTNHIEGEMLRQKLLAVGIKATLNAD